MATSNVLVITDSRGKGLEELLFKKYKHTPEINVTVRTYGGATLDSMKRKLDRLRRKYDLTIVISGICNFTKRELVKNRKVLSYNNGNDKVEHVSKLIKEIVHKDCIIATIAPASLRKYAETVNLSGAIPQQEEEQKNLLKDLETVNKEIKQTCADREAQFLNLAKTVFQTAKKKRGKTTRTVQQFKANRLPDGIHLSQDLRKNWARNIAGAINRHIGYNPDKDYCPKKKVNSEEEESQSDSGNFKRAGTRSRK